MEVKRANKTHQNNFIINFEIKIKYINSNNKYYTVCGCEVVNSNLEMINIHYIGNKIKIQYVIVIIYKHAMTQ